MDDDRALQDTLAALEMPRRGVARWLRHERAFCEAHGGARVYAELLALFAECEAELEKDPGAP